MAETIRFVVTSEYDGVKAGRFLRTVCKLSARTLSLLKRTEGSLTVDGKLLRTIDILKEGDVIEFKLPDENNTIEPIKGELDILFEDEYLLIVNKPSGMPVHPVKDHQRDTLANIVAFRYSNFGSEFVFRAVNRLDRDTTGIVIIAKDKHTASVMQNVDVQKSYLAVCEGDVPLNGTIDKPINLSSDSKIVRTVADDGQVAVTHYRKIASVNNASLVELSLETGRTHQIRCHMSYLGFPLFGDDLYGGSLDYINRQALHCSEVSFIHPFTNEKIYVTCDLPSDMKKLINDLSIQ